MSSFEKKISPFLEFKDKLDQEEAKKLGLKDEEQEVEKFIQVRQNLFTCLRCLFNYGEDCV